VRVLHVAHNSLPHIGGLETVVAAETRGLAARGWQVTLVSSSNPSARPGVRTESGVRVVRVRAWHGTESRFAVPFPVFSPWLVVVMAREVRKADLVHVHDPLYLTSWAAALWCLLLRRRYVVHRHVGFVHHSSFVVRGVQRLVLATLGRLVLGRADAVVAIDEQIAASTRQATDSPERVRVVGNGVDAGLFRPPEQDERERVRERLRLPAGGALVLFVGRFVPKKGFPWVVAAASDHYRLVFAGGDRPPGLDDDRLLFLGGLPASEMPEVYRSADVMVVASVGECPLTVLEAMSSGLPVVVNDDPAMHTAWTAGPGVVFVDMAAGELRRTLEQLASDHAGTRRLGGEARSFVRDTFSWDAHVDGVEELYREVLG
jgi:glycosyltransferase involved in cell wall biosynthesis